MGIKVLFFGSVTDITIVSELSREDCADTDTLEKELLKQFPALANKKYFLALNQQVIHENCPLKQGDIVALMPPFSGG
ncbi:MoaD/ThiS family protein [Sediminibacterium salmoneum]|uniref:MoaD/ThiS family protein n=1 Tax=Sediminibacterium salmoneum TaxID=426421 RepID=UPI00047CC66E|nr:MoaD/ThiS family protein [Sediminibacterium salmoneum]